jgi:hypothetical protein
MKRILISFILMIGSLCFGQETNWTFYLKNGNIVRGKVILEVDSTYLILQKITGKDHVLQRSNILLQRESSFDYLGLPEGAPKLYVDPFLCALSNVWIPGLPFFGALEQPVRGVIYSTIAYGFLMASMYYSVESSLTFGPSYPPTESEIRLQDLFLYGFLAFTAATTVEAVHKARIKNQATGHTRKDKRRYLQYSFSPSVDFNLYGMQTAPAVGGQLTIRF